MKKKLLAGILALALCSTNMPPQTIFAGEFTSGTSEVVSEEETPEIFTNEEQEAAGETDEELSVFSSEEVPEFDDAPDEAMAAAENAQNGVIDLTDDIVGGVYTITSAGDYKFICSNSQKTANRIVVDGDTISEQGNINIYLNNVNINTSDGPALQIADSVKAKVTIRLTGTNNLITTKQQSAGLQKDNEAQLIITSASDATAGVLNASSDIGAGIGGSDRESCSNITINGGSVTASSEWGAGIGGGEGGSCSNITITGGLVTANSKNGAGIGGGCFKDVEGSGSNITITGGFVTASSKNGAGIGGGSGGSGNNITINGGSVNARSTDSGAGIGGGSGGSGSKITISGGSVTAGSGSGAGIGSGEVGSCEDITITGGSVTASSGSGAGIGSGDRGSCKNIIINGGSVKANFGSGSPKPKNDQGDEVYCCTIENQNLENVIIDGNSTSWEPKNHQADEKILYAWLTGKTHTISVGEKKQTYYFDNNEFKLITNNDFTLSLADLKYTGKAQAPLTCNNGIIKDEIQLSYYKNNVLQQNGAINVGTYTVTANIAGNSFTDSSWTFTIYPALEAPGYTTQPQISVSWSCKKISDITDSLPINWIWSSKVDPNQDLQVGKPITATAVYNGDDKGNYEKESITYTITRKECEHKNKVGRYYSSPSCTSSGYSGDTYCADCGVLISSGYTISAYGHDYDSGIITTEPSAETDGIITYTCKWCKHQDTKTLGKLGDGEPYIEGSFQKKGWDAVNDLIRASKEKDTISITLNGAKVLPATVLSEIKGKDISLNLDMENGFIWKINGTSITAETPADTDLSVTNTAEYIPAALYSLISTNQNDFGFHLGRSGAFDFPAVLSVKADASCAGLMANLFWYDVENGVLQCIQTVTVGGAFERSIPYVDFTLSKGQDYFMAFGTESLNGRVIHTDGSITDENGVYLRPADAKISSHSIDRNKLTVKLSKGCAGAQGYDFVISKKSNMLQTGKFSQTVSSTGKPQASFRYLAKGTWYVAARSWFLDAQGNKVYGSWTKVKKIKITVVTPQQPKIRNITVKGNTVTITYTKCKNATGYEILLGNKYKTSAGEKYPVKKHLKRTENTTTVTFTNVKKGTWYVTIRAWNQTSKDKSRVYSPYSSMKKFKTKK